MKRAAILLLMLLVSACATPPVPEICQEKVAASQVGTNHWLAEGAWQLRQLVLLEIGWNKFALNGFLEVDAAKRRARLVALNEMGLVIFDLSIDGDSSRFNRALPQLLEREGLDRLIAASIRRIFFTSVPASGVSDVRGGFAAQLDKTAYLYSCNGQLSSLETSSADEDWTVRYGDYQNYQESVVPRQIELTDRRSHLHLQLWIREIKGKS